MTNMNDLVIGLTDHAASQSDRWLFLFTLLTMLSGLIILWRWITADRASINTRLTAITDRHIATTEHLSQVVANNTEAMRRVEVAVSGCRDLQTIRWRQENPGTFTPAFPPEKRP